MFKGAKLVANIIITLGIIALLFGIVTIFGLGAIFSGINATNSGQAAIVPILSFFTFATGAPIVLGSFLIIGFGELIILVSHIAEKL